MAPMKIIMLMELHALIYKDQISTFNGSTASHRILRQMIQDNLVERNPQVSMSTTCLEHGYQLTDRGQALVHKLCETPLPVLEEKWV